MATGMCLMQRHRAPTPNMGKRVPKPCNKLGPTSPQIIARLTRSKDEQTALPAGETGHRDRAGARGSMKSWGARKQLPKSYFNRV